MLLQRSCKWAVCSSVLAIGFLVSQPVAFADGITVSAAAGAAIGNQCDCQQFLVTNSTSAVTVVPLNAALAINQFGISSGAAASASGEVQFGSITGALGATSSESSSLFPPGVQLTNAAGSAEFDGTWVDELTVTSNTLAAGEPVELAFLLSADLNLTCSDSGQASVSAVASMTGSIFSAQLSDQVCNSAFKQSQTLTVLTNVGATIPIQGQLNLVTSAAGLNELTVSSSIDPSAQVFIDSLTPGASYTTASGTNYSSPAHVPEPSSLLLLGSELLALLGVSRVATRARKKI